MFVLSFLVLVEITSVFTLTCYSSSCVIVTLILRNKVSVQHTRLHVCCPGDAGCSPNMQKFVFAVRSRNEFLRFSRAKSETVAKSSSQRNIRENAHAYMQVV